MARASSRTWRISVSRSITECGAGAGAFDTGHAHRMIRVDHPQDPESHHVLAQFDLRGISVIRPSAGKPLPPHLSVLEPEDRLAGPTRELAGDPRSRAFGVDLLDLLLHDDIVAPHLGRVSGGVGHEPAVQRVDLLLGQLVEPRRVEFFGREQLPHIWPLGARVAPRQYRHERKYESGAEPAAQPHVTFLAAFRVR